MLKEKEFMPMLNKKVFMCSLKQRKKRRVAQRRGGSKNGLAENDRLVPGLPNEIVSQIFSRISRSEYLKFACVNKKFESFIGDGHLYKVRREVGVVEYWVYLLISKDWEAFDLVRRRWVKLPEIPSKETFPHKDSFAVGTELLTFGEHIRGFPIWTYSLLSRNWLTHERSCHPMNTQRTRFASSSQGKIAVVAGGYDKYFQYLKSAEMYDSETHIWEALPDMHVPRISSSGFFMDGKFYVIGGGSDDLPSLTCGEEYNFETKTWRRIEGMHFKRSIRGYPPAPLVAVINNELYAADELYSKLIKYDKTNNSWSTIGRLPVHVRYPDCPISPAFKSCGDKLIMVCTSKNMPNKVTLYSWFPEDGHSGQVEWSVLSCKDGLTDGAAYNCVVMGC